MGVALIETAGEAEEEESSDVRGGLVAAGSVLPCFRSRYLTQTQFKQIYEKNKKLLL